MNGERESQTKPTKEFTTKRELQSQDELVVSRTQMLSNVNKGMHRNQDLGCWASICE
jgi:hypothetical protein